MLFTLTYLYNLHIHQMNVKFTFLNVDLYEEIYMKQLEGVILTRNENKMCKLTKSLYGLKQALIMAWKLWIDDLIRWFQIY